MTRIELTATTFAAVGGLAVTIVRYHLSPAPIQSLLFSHFAFLVVVLTPVLWVLVAQFLATREFQSLTYWASGGALCGIGLATFSPLGLVLIPGAIGLLAVGKSRSKLSAPMPRSSRLLIALVFLGFSSMAVLLYAGGTEACWRELLVDGEQVFERVPYQTRLSVAPGETAMYCSERAPTVVESASAVGMALFSTLLVSLGSNFVRRNRGE